LSDWTPLHYAGVLGCMKIFEFLLRNGADLYTVKYQGTCLHWAAENGQFSVVEYLVNQKADINAKDYGNITPLHYAAQNGHLCVVEYLVNQKADINAKNNDVEFLFLIGLLFIMLLKMIILVLLNI